MNDLRLPTKKKQKEFILNNALYIFIDNYIF